MQVAQGLYEGVDLGKELGTVGLITYMRTDSLRVSDDAVQAVRETIAETYGEDHLPAKPNEYRAKKNAQEAHEAIRPTSLELDPESIKKYLKDEQYKLYKLIWDRFLASQMSPAVYDQTGVDIEATVTPRGRRIAATGSAPAAGCSNSEDGSRPTAKDRVAARGQAQLAGEDENNEERRPTARRRTARPGAKPRRTRKGDLARRRRKRPRSPSSAKERSSNLVAPPGVITEQKFTQPPARYNEGSLVRELEKRGIGRPSTYAEIISKVQARDYVEKIPSGGLKPTLLGKFVVDGLVSSSLDFMDPNFTAKMEEDLDEVGAGRLGRVALLGRFYKRFRQQLDISKKQKRWSPEPTETDQICAECGSKMLKRWSKNGWFLGCSGYPKCKVTQDSGPTARGPPIPLRMTDYKCDKCQKPMVIKTGRYGEFLSCTGYPECKSARPVPLGIPCPNAAAISSRSIREGVAVAAFTGARTTRPTSSASSSSGKNPLPSLAPRVAPSSWYSAAARRTRCSPASPRSAGSRSPSKKPSPRSRGKGRPSASQ